ncbi:phospholipase D family protein [Lacinutrix neustonica]|uniref:Phospholipase D family protein n=1 Tax=Lacinutrix neustonica TaxID=2980107 RepID=A0A9E8MWX8_9FLAO|nr:phospholipase D family protein [Lacinutrix neustonica]WAC02082.1 phospholipase D family protein [Lacinutrix neustonica]
MAKFLTTTANSYHIEDIILNAQDTITLVTPYLKLSQNLIDRIKDADRKDIKIILIYGKDELKESQQKVLYSLNNIDIYYFHNLHAKCYYNETNMIVTSMNLYEFSEKNNREMGILLDSNLDRDLFLDAKNEVHSIINNSQNILNKNNSKSETIENAYELDYDEFEKIKNLKLTENLKEAYSEFKVKTENDKIEIENFPLKGINLEINGRIDFIFNDNSFYRDVKKHTSNKINNLPERYFWNRLQINAYPEKNFIIEYSNNGVNKSITKDLSIIKSVYTILNHTFDLSSNCITIRK